MNHFLFPEKQTPEVNITCFCQTLSADTSCRYCKLSKSDRKTMIIKKDDKVCSLCNKTFENMTVRDEHIPECFLESASQKCNTLTKKDIPTIPIQTFPISLSMKENIDKFRKSPKKEFELQKEKRKKLDEDFISALKQQKEGKKNIAFYNNVNYSSFYPTIVQYNQLNGSTHEVIGAAIDSKSCMEFEVNNKIEELLKNGSFAYEQMKQIVIAKFENKEVEKYLYETAIPQIKLELQHKYHHCDQQ